jgi:hypothetical protein
MEFGDFCHHFEEVEICNLGPEVMNEISQMLDPDADKLTRRPESAWTAYAADGQWSRQAGTAGGCKNNG